MLEQSPKEAPPTLEELLWFLDYVYMEAGLLAAYDADYPLVEPRELVPSFDAPFIEYRHLPAFSMLVLDRQLSYQDEGFQFDILLPEGTPPDAGVAAQNRQTLRDRLPRNLIPELEKELGRKAPTPFSRFTKLLPLLFSMDRGHVIAKGPDGNFRLGGIFASFPSDLDGEIKRFGRQIGKFAPGDNESYARNRQFVYRFLMEQSGFPICGERHTSAALFSRRLMRRKESFAMKVLGQSDRTITTLTSLGGKNHLPRVSKVALVSARACGKEGQKRLEEEGFMVDPARRTIILRVTYTQHSYHHNNVLEDRALSVLGQEVIHPQTGQPLEMDVLGLGRDRLLMLNDIVRGEHQGTIVFRDSEEVQGTADMGSRLKFLLAWLKKHWHILADYSPDTFERVGKVIKSFLDDPDLQKDFQRLPDLHKELETSLPKMRMAHRLRLLEKLVYNRADASGRKLQHVHIIIILVHVLSQEGDELLETFPGALDKLLHICEKQLANAYLKRRYLSKPPKGALERELVGHYRLLESLVDRYSKAMER
ncbi:hypothetical protein AAU61_15970 [Desulfocarbo indianensis]|nr:hypothetical protein AAU61_15970 [Desulfocarbo indianensis]